MKKIISLITLLAICTVLLTGCGKLNVNKAVKALKAKGFTESVTYKTADDLADGTELFNTQIEYWKGDFTVKLKDYTVLVAERNPEKDVEFITFSSKREARAYAELFVTSRSDYDNSKIATSGAVVVITGLDMVMDMLELDFK